MLLFTQLFSETSKSSLHEICDHLQHGSTVVLLLGLPFLEERLENGLVKGSHGAEAGALEVKVEVLVVLGHLALLGLLNVLNFALNLSFLIFLRKLRAWGCSDTFAGVNLNCGRHESLRSGRSFGGLL